MAVRPQSPHSVVSAACQKPASAPLSHHPETQPLERTAPHSHLSNLALSDRLFVEI
ncbi:hypothetical protein CTAM01_05870 [Colletotrichum tamarilloi]|uniref:Uncharacterized protein n=1 Tax=Colletotrichum tamarilloi TaxID=1209934 RepID=A0ABQ9RDS9_9PEZI|nr:uncharacterized protein CTAM01_05870 [Colletotrichum tamarilloi]KAK1501646.1 hypothetical protein CTAM01_05870 [Colletotrichum tamarilloi]